MNEITTWLTDNAIWIGAVGGIAATTSLLVQLFRRKESVPEKKNADNSARNNSLANTGEISSSTININHSPSKDKDS